MAKTRETANAIYYRTNNDDTAQMIAAIGQAFQSSMQAVLKKQLEIRAMKEAFTQMSPDQQEQLYNSWSEKERKMYGVSPRKKTAAEEADERNRIAQAATAEATAARQPLLTQELQDRVAAGKITLQEATRLNNIINDPNADLWDKAFAQGLRGDDAERFVLNKKYPDMADALLQTRNKVGPEYEKRLTGEYFQEIVKETGQVDPAYTLRTAKALAKSIAMGDPAELDKLNADPKWPEAMKTLAFRRFKLDVDQMHEARAGRVSNERQTLAQISMRLIEQLNVPADAAQDAARALMSGRSLAGTWTGDQLAKARGIVNEAKEGQIANMALEVREKMSGIPEIRQGLETLRQLQRDEVGGPNTEKQIKQLQQEMMQRLSKLYGISEAEMQDSQGFWSRVFNGAISAAGSVGPGLQTISGLTGDALKASGVPGLGGVGLGSDPLMDLLTQDDMPVTPQPTTPQGRSNFGQPSSPTPPAGMPPSPFHAVAGMFSEAPGSRTQGELNFRGTLTPPATPRGSRPPAAPTATAAVPARKEALRSKAINLLAELPTADPARKSQILTLLAAIRQDPEGLAVLTETSR